MRRLLTLLVAMGASAPVAAAAQPVDGVPQSPSRGFGERASFVFGVDNVLGFTSDRIGKETVDSSGLFPGFFGPTLALHGVLHGGLTLGANLGGSYLHFSDLGSSRNGDSFFVTTLAPRIGYAGNSKATFGYWIRGGPSLRMIFPDDGESTQLVGAGFELLGVITPVEHFGVTFGPTIDVGLAASRGDSKFSTFGVALGLLTDLGGAP